MSPPAFLGLLSFRRCGKMAQVVEVLQTPNCFLIFNQSLEPDHGEGE
ncbi:MAG: hypothetical protein Q8O91_05055 [Candidatus Aminicenantes bacterium]|nr:hypothetical protein [Candidatus Aminicenantes bacterium]